MNSKIKELLTNTAVFAIANMGSKIMVFLMVPLYTAVLTTEEYGIADMAQTTATMLFPILSLMISEAVLRFCFIKDYSVQEVYSIGLRITLIGIFFCVLVSLLFPKFPLFDELGHYVWFIPILFTTNSLVNLFHKFAMGIDKVKVSAFAGLLQTLTVIVLNLIFLLVFKIGVLGYLIAYAIGDVVVIVYIAFNTKAFSSYIRNSNICLRNSMLSYSIPLVPNSLSWWALSSVNRYLALAWIGVSAVGIYSATLRLPSILTVLCDIFAQAWLLSAIKGYGSDESKSFIISMYNKYFSLLIAITAFMIILAYPFAKVLLSGEFDLYWWVTPFLYISVFYGALVGFLGSVFSAERKNSIQFISTMCGALISILITILLLKEHGIIILSISTMIGYYLIWLIRSLSVKKYIHLGVSILNASVQGLILLVEAICVASDMYYGAITCIVLLFLINYKELYKMAIFLFNELNNYIKNKL